MRNFDYYIPTVVHFGKDQISHLADLRASGTKVLLCYGGGSIKRSGLYDTAMEILKGAGLEVFELAGVEPNPRIETVRKGVEICKANNIDMVLAIGGGSTIDCAKIVAAGAKYDGDAWDLVIDWSKLGAALPIYCVVTIAATGSEMDHLAVITDLTKNEKWGTGGMSLKPTMSILDPTYTETVPAKQTSAGVADIMSHTFENYFHFVDGCEMQKGFGESILKTCVKYGPVALNDPTNYDARAALMWCSSLAINGLLSYGCEVAWGVHAMEHELSAFYDITHGQGLAILTPVWMEHILSEKTAPNFAQMGRAVFDIKEECDMEAAKATIAALKKFFFETMQLPANLRAVGINEKNNFEAMAVKAAAQCEYAFVPLTKEDVVAIFEAAF